MKILLNNKFIDSLIVINSIITIYLCFNTPPFQNQIIFIDHIFTLIFIAEMGYKLYFYGIDFFKGKWNRFDFLVVLISSIPLLLLLFNVNINGLDYLLILRSFRLFKFFRLIKIIPNLSKVYYNFIKAIKITSGLAIGGFIILVVISIILCCMFKTISPEYFGDPFISIYSVFRLFSIEGWYEIPDKICESVNYFNATLVRILFSCIVLFGTFILGFLISQLSDTLAEDNNDELLEKNRLLEEKLNELNSKIDILIGKVNKNE